MRYLKYLALLAVCVFAAAAPSQAQVSVGVGVGPVYGGYGAPVCAYGYYDYSPYACAPYGYYGPDWFVGGVFIGAGPWFYGRGGYWGRGWGGRGWDGRGGWGRRGFDGRGRGFDGRGGGSTVDADEASTVDEAAGLDAHGSVGGWIPRR